MGWKCFVLCGPMASKGHGCDVVAVWSIAQDGGQLFVLSRGTTRPFALVLIWDGETSSAAEVWFGRCWKRAGRWPGQQACPSTGNDLLVADIGLGSPFDNVNLCRLWEVLLCFGEDASAKCSQGVAFLLPFPFIF